MAATQQILIPQYMKDVINHVVEADEGGWVLTENPNDPDGGWTFGGITEKNWVPYVADGKCAASTIKSVIKTDIVNHAIQGWIDRGIQIYHQQFYKPMIEVVGDHNDPDSAAENRMHFSCIVNRGPQTFEVIFSEACNAHKQETSAAEYTKAFCKAWIDHYIQLVKANAEAWEHYATATEVARETGEVKAPATLRAEFLQGWINRVWKYMP